MFENHTHCHTGIVERFEKKAELLLGKIEICYD